MNNYHWIDKYNNKILKILLINIHMRTCITLVLLFVIANASLETIMLRKSFSKNVDKLTPTD